MIPLFTHLQYLPGCQIVDLFAGDVCGPKEIVGPVLGQGVPPAWEAFLGSGNGGVDLLFASLGDVAHNFFRVGGIN